VTRGPFAEPTLFKGHQLELVGPGKQSVESRFIDEIAEPALRCCALD
jgi:hypothetical protein